MLGIPASWSNAVPAAISPMLADLPMNFSPSFSQKAEKAPLKFSNAPGSFVSGTFSSRKLSRDVWMLRSSPIIVSRLIIAVSKERPGR